MNITVSANAKLNLYLDITGKRSDGYHTISSVMHTVDLRDSVTMELTSDPEIKITCDKPYVPTDERNIAHKAARLFFDECGEKKGVRIDILKRIPVGGGLGGSSTDGAAVLSGLNYLLRKPFSDGELLSLGARLGADVPFCIKKGAALCEGIGDILTPLSPLSHTFAVILKPPFSLNTKNMYSLFDNEKEHSAPCKSQILSAVKSDCAMDIASSLYNAFTPVAEKINPELSGYLSSLSEIGALGSEMSGSGSCVFGIFSSLADCKRAAYKLSEKSLSAYPVRLI